MVEKIEDIPLGFTMLIDVDESPMMLARKKGTYEKWLLDLISERFRPDAGVFVDGGVNKGYHSLYVASQFPKSQIYGFEPLADNCQSIQKSIVSNGFKNITIIEKALYDTPGQMTLHEGNKSGWNSLVFRKDCNTQNTFSIETTTIDIEMKGIPVDFIKLDIEGSEYQALIGAERTLKNVRTIVIEYCQDIRLDTFGYNLQSFLNLFKRHGFTVTYQGQIEKGRGHLIAKKR